MKDRWNLNKSQRMQLKAFICLLGLLLLVFLFLGKFVAFLVHRGDGGEQPPVPEQTAEPHEPVVRQLVNVWILEADQEGILLFREGERERYAYGTVEAGKGELPVAEALREQLADVELTDGRVTEVTPKTEKISGRILGADGESLEVEGYGRLPLAEGCRGYRLYGSLAMCGPEDLFFGYNCADLCLEDGKICGILLAREPDMEYIRVLLRTADYGGIYHDRLVITSEDGFTVTYGPYDGLDTEVYQAGEEVAIDRESEWFRGERIVVAPDALTGKIKLRNVARSQGEPSYRGEIELLLTDQGIVAINQVALEEYLYSVVPSEMPAGYPAEALKAQAICARTYAYSHMQHAGYPQYGAHVDDSTTYQVYNNIPEQESTTTAVRETYGQLLYTAQGETASTYYYSTSCGVGSDATVWKTEQPPDLPYLKARSLSLAAMTAQTAAIAEGRELPEDDIGERLREESAFAEFITSVNRDDFEAQEPWYRWTYRVEKLDPGRLAEALQARYQANSRLVLTLKDGEYESREIGDIGDIHEICVAGRGPGGVAEELVIEAEKGTYKVISEHNIRYVLNNGESPVVRQDGSRVSSPSLLPSGFFVIETGKKNGNVVAYSLTGGGYGHGVGMSQNGAARMADSGFDAGEILEFFFQGCRVAGLYEE